MSRPGFFVVLMALKRVRQFIPLYICAGVIGFVLVLQALPTLKRGDTKRASRDGQFQKLAPDRTWNFINRLEWILYDWRVRLAAQYSPASRTNLGAVLIEESSILSVASGAYGKKFGLLWPRNVFARLVQELSAEGAKTVAFDVVFKELREDQNFLRFPTDPPLAPDEYFARELRQASNVILAVTHEAIPHDLFRTNAAALGDITAEKDGDGILRRVRPYRDYSFWHPAIISRVKPLSLDLSRAEIATNRIAIPCCGDGSFFEVPLLGDGSIDLEALGEPAVAGQKVLQPVRVWHMGIALATSELGLDLAKAEITSGEIILGGPDGLQRRIPIDAEGLFNVDWTFRFTDPHLEREEIEKLLDRDFNRERGEKYAELNRWKNKLVVVGSTVVGSNLSDIGATALENETFLLSTHWNVANSVLMDRFIERSSYAAESVLIVMMGALAALLTWRMRVLVASLCVALTGLFFIALAAYLFVRYRYWLPIVLPVFGALMMNHVGLVTFRLMFEQGERRRVKSIFSKIVAPQVVNELLSAETISLGGARREVTVLFSDLRGFTEFTELIQHDAEETVRLRKLQGAEAESHFDQQATEALNTVNTYLSLIADMVIKHQGTLDKYIGDCVMAFWGAPSHLPNHAALCVRAAITALRAMERLNQERGEENTRRTEENQRRLATGEEPMPLLPVLTFGVGINTGKVTVGLMGSDEHILNYTVFGREVNLAARLESVSGTGRIIISEATFAALQATEPSLAVRCIERSPVTVKGFRKPVRIFEVPWREQPVHFPAESAALIPNPTEAQ